MHPKDWTIEQTADWVVKSAKLSANYRDIFMENEVNGVALLALKQDDLKAMGINKIGPLTALSSSLAALKKRFNVTDT